MTESERIARALALIANLGGVDGAHHKQWVLDQVARALLDGPAIERVMRTGEIWTEYGESAAYRAWVAACEAGEDGPRTYAWDTGIAP